MALQEKLDRFKKQQEKCQSIMSSAAKAGASRAPTTSKSTPAAAPPAARPPAPAVKFSNDTERLQFINSIRKAPVGAQIKRVIDRLLEVLIQPLFSGFFMMSIFVLVLFRNTFSHSHSDKCI